MVSCIFTPKFLHSRVIMSSSLLGWSSGPLPVNISIHGWLLVPVVACSADIDVVYHSLLSDCFVCNYNGDMATTVLCRVFIHFMSIIVSSLFHVLSSKFWTDYR